MSTDHAPIVPIRTYVTIFVSLLVFTGITVFAAHQDFGALNTTVALLIAVTKASLVVLFFMHLRYESRSLSFVFVGSLVVAVGIALALATLTGQFLVFRR